MKHGDEVGFKLLSSDDWFDLNTFKNTVAKTPGVDNGSLTNLPKKFWKDAYKVTPTKGSKAKAVVDDIIANGDNLGTKTEGLVDDVMSKNGYQKADGKYVGQNGSNGFDGVYYKGTLDDPTEIIIIESKQMSASGSVSLNAANFNTGLPEQMSDSWIVYVTEKLDDAGKRQISDMINDNFRLIEKYVGTVDKTKGEINFLKLGSY